ncbi:hypothetical protein P170DRAFT_432738 [Aspergillus steynii IBT 23096]|uniref:Retrovirus-related Pol polyprotein from transposon TNT 1-94-like beta-barrel domain-containing protein n=1 Tax=Aspergillus steynii IBT 23096 TaxID=1392250 RepID=A0A2I2GQP8_9EURO|nr:uncharacterized protein P170DRAFT_432738 [Aspergillus steynii IBT 23096]PLB55205.1 hypothetical protein P170DRAFT_432738 [Aspergillus steynii IBT 23096]
MPDLKSYYHDFPQRRTPQSPRPKSRAQNLASTTTTKSRSRSQSPAASYNRCWDWIVVGGNCHYAKNRASFRTYRRAPGKIGGNKVLGVGTVELQVRRGSGDERTNTLVLQDVLHLPNARCNGLSVSKYREANPLSAVETEKEHFQATSDVDGEPLWCADEYCGLSRVVLAGSPKGQSYLRDGQVYMLSVIASSDELDRLSRKLRDSDWTVHS